MSDPAMNLRILPPDSLMEFTLEGLPLSKSMLARALMLSASAGRPAPAVGPGEGCDDVSAMVVGITLPERIDVGASGTAFRFLTALAAATPGCVTELTGVPRLLERPMAPLVDALRSLGADIDYEPGQPARVRGRRLRGGAVSLDATVSSQYASALLLASPLMEAPVEIDYQGDPVSRPYLDLTLRMLAGEGGDGREADWSAASFWYELAALTCGFFTLRGLNPRSLQPDAACARLFANLGVQTSASEDGPGVDLCASPDITPRFTADLSDNPDLVPPLTVACALLRVPFSFTGLSTLRVKECDRVAALAEELARLGLLLDAGPDSLAWEGRTMPVAEMPVFDPHCDHRMAMALALVSVFVPGIVVRDAGCVAKSYPAFWDHLRAAGFTIIDADEPLPEGEENPPA